MKFISYVFVLAFTLATVNSANVAISSDQVAVVVGAGLSGLVSIQLPDGQENILTLPAFEDMINAFEDVTIDPENPTLVFTMGEADQSVCGWTIESDASLDFGNCVVGDFGGPYSGISANAGTLVISGGTAGFTVYSYDTSTGVIATTSKYFRKKVNETTVFSSPDVLLIDGNNAALSSQFIVEGGLDVPRFGTLIVNLVLPEEKDNFKVANSLGTSDLAMPPSNYPLENAVYTTGGTTYMYTASGALTVQDPFVAGSTTELAITNSSVFTAAVNSARRFLILGGVDVTGGFTTGDYSIGVYDLADPLNPVLVDEVFDVGRVASVATNGNFVVYAITEGTVELRTTSYSFFQLPATPPTPAPQPTDPTDRPSTMPSSPPIPSPRPSFTPPLDPTIMSGNVQVSSDMVAVVAGVGLGGLVSRRLPNGEENTFRLPYNVDQITGFEDVAIDPDDPMKVFALGKTESQVCSFAIQEDASLLLIGCKFDYFDVNPYSGISAKDGTLVISGGKNGFTMWGYDKVTGVIGENATYVNEKLPNAIYHSDALLVNSRFAAMSTEFSDTAKGEPKFGTMMVDLNTGQELFNFRVEKSMGVEAYALAPSNFPLQSALYSEGNQTVMFTASGALTVQDPFVANTTVEIVFPDFSVFTVAVNEEKKVLVLGGVNGQDEYSIVIYYIGNPLEPFKFYEVFGLPRLTSLATQGDLVAYTTTATAGPIRRTFYSWFELPEMSPTMAPRPSATPSEAPSISARPTVTPEPTQLPSTGPSPGPSVSSRPTITSMPTQSTDMPVQQGPASDSSRLAAVSFGFAATLMMATWLA